MTGTPSVTRLLLLPAIAFAVALGVHLLLAAAGVPSDNPVRFLATPLIGALIVYFGLRGFSRPRRLRTATLVAVGLLLIGLLA